MSLKAHLVELRNRIFISTLAILLAGIAGWYMYGWVFDQLVEPLRALDEENRNISVNFGITTAFNQQIMLSLWLGVIMSSPVWIYQIWAFITPGLTRKERWYAVAFMAASIPLFLAGVVLAWLVLPNAVRFLVGWAPDSTLASNIIQVSDYISFVTRVMLAFGIAFLTPVVMVTLTLMGLLSGRAWLKGWRFAIVACFTFAAIASPTPDIQTMFALAAPMILLYFLAVAVTLFVDRRRERLLAREFGGDLDDDEASVLDDEASPLDAEPAPLDDDPPAPHAAHGATADAAGERRVVDAT